MRTRLPLAGLPATSAFTRTYIEDFAQVSAWFDYDPQAADCCAARLAELDANRAPEQQALYGATAGLAAAQQERWGADGNTIEAARRLGEPNTYMVVTGQQPGLLGGPIYTQLKAITTILL